MHSGIQNYRTPIFVLVLFLLSGLWNLGGPPAWWDEGWTLSVARHVAERGMYVRLLNGASAANGLEAAIPVTETVALAFRLLGVGLWQGRLPFVLSAAIALSLLWLLAERLFDRQIAWASMVVTLFLAPHPQLHALIQGRQVLAELPMLAALLAGALLLCPQMPTRPPTPTNTQHTTRFTLAWQHWLLASVAALCWAIALSLKAQTTPFLMASIAVSIIIALVLRQWQSALSLGIAGVGAYLLLSPLQVLYLRWAAPPLTSQAVSGLYDVTAVVTTTGNRIFALTMFLTFGLVSGIGLLYGTWNVWQEIRRAVPTRQLIIRMVILAIAGAWMAWFVLLSVGVPRYMFPPVFLAAPFVAILLRDLTQQFNGIATLQRMAAPLRERRISRASAKAWLAAFLLILALPFGMLTLSRYYFFFSDDSAQRTATFFNTQTPPNTRIETYESELHFLLNRPYHWPPDQTHVELNRRSLLGQKTAILYDPLTFDPDYLVIGEFARGNKLYEPVITSGAFKLLQKIGGYEVYVRVR